MNRGTNAFPSGSLPSSGQGASRFPDRLLTISGPRGATGEKAVKTAMTTSLKVLGIASLVALGACQSKEAENVQNAYDNVAENIENQADNVEGMADNMTGNAAAAAENTADALENKADAVKDAGEHAADAVDNKH
jgi:uncharacterized protein YjbJ (UPF0337 family)